MHRSASRRAAAAAPFRMLCLLSSLGLSSVASAADTESVVGVPPDGSNGGEYVLRQQSDELTPRQREEIQEELRRNTEQLEREGLLPPPVHSLLPPPLAWPLRSNGIADPGVHGISNFVDQNPSYTNFLRDWNCGARTYDTSAGYNHSGTDIFLWPFAWRKVANSQVQVVAAAPGTIIGRWDGNYDQNCAFNNGNWNAVYVRHADGSVAWYGHMKNGSVTAKGVGAAVAQGEYLGVVGSSGNSTGPHLHLEVYDAAGRLNDPYQGACNALNANSWWAAQRPYYDSAVNKLTTGFAAPVFPACPGIESPNEKTAFRFGEPAYFTAYYRDQLSGQPSTYRIYRPDGSLYTSWSHSSAQYYSASYWYWYWTSFAPTGPAGTWRFEVTFNGVTTSTLFTMSP